jgi:hypothetical protein
MLSASYHLVYANNVARPDTEAEFQSTDVEIQLQEKGNEVLLKPIDRKGCQPTMPLSYVIIKSCMHEHVRGVVNSSCDLMKTVATGVWIDQQKEKVYWWGRIRGARKYERPLRRIWF